MYIVFDTETINLDNPFCYDLGYIIYEDNGDVVLRRHFLIKSIFENAELFKTAFFASKRPFYAQWIENHNIDCVANFDEAMYSLQTDLEHYGITDMYAYNSPFDVKVFDFNSKWENCPNPLEDLNIFDIRGYVHKCIAFTPNFKEFCERNKFYSASGHYSTSAEVVARYLLNDVNFTEEHISVDDCEIENEILRYCISKGCELGKEYKIYQSVPRKKHISVLIDGEVVLETDAKSVRLDVMNDEVVIK